MRGIVTPSSTRPTAVRPRPHHWRRPTLKPKIRSAITASSTTPPARTAWTTESGASAIAATWSSQAPSADAPCRSRTTSSSTARPRCAAGARCRPAGRAGPAVLVEEREVRGERAEQREQDAELESHAGEGTRTMTRCRAADESESSARASGNVDRSAVPQGTPSAADVTQLTRERFDKHPANQRFRCCSWTSTGWSRSLVSRQMNVHPEPGSRPTERPIFISATRRRSPARAA